MAGFSPVDLFGYGPASRLACALRTDQPTEAADWLWLLGHTALNAAVIGGVAKYAEADNKRSAMYGVGGAMAVSMLLCGVAYYREECKVATVMGTKISVSQQIFFDYDKASIKPVSYPVLDEVYKVMVENPEVSVEVQGHTDNQGAADYNKKLSQARAESVMEYLVKRGIAPTRLTAKGYGLEVPIASNLTEIGRAQNRRVEFIRTDVKALSEPVKTDVKVAGLVSPEF